MRILFFLLGLAMTQMMVQAYRQELTLIDTVNGRVSTFYRPLPDTSEYGLQSVDRICVTGIWAFYGAEDYSDGYYVIGSGGPAQLCENKKFAFRSFRYMGANETEVDALSLYTGKGPFSGPEIYVEASPFGGNFRSVKSFASTGQSKWTLFEGANFDGKSICWQGQLNSLTNYNFEKTLTKLSTVGSVVKGCPTPSVAVRDQLRQTWSQTRHVPQRRPQ